MAICNLRLDRTTFAVKRSRFGNNHPGWKLTLRPDSPKGDVGWIPCQEGNACQKMTIRMVDVTVWSSAKPDRGIFVKRLFGKPAGKSAFENSGWALPRLCSPSRMAGIGQAIQWRDFFPINPFEAVCDLTSRY